MLATDDDSDDALFWDTVGAAESESGDDDGGEIGARTGKSASASAPVSARRRTRLVVLDGASIGEAHAAELRQCSPAATPAAAFSALGVQAALDHFDQDADVASVVAFVPEELLDPLHGRGGGGSARVLQELRDAQRLYGAPRGVDSFIAFLQRYMRSQLEEHGHDCVVVSNASTDVPLQQQNFFFCGDEFYVV